MKSPININHISAGFTSVLVGYTSSVIIILQAATASGANTKQTASWLLALGIAMGVTSIAYSWRFKTPILTAWSTPGAAMLATQATSYSYEENIAAFIVSGLLISLTGLIKPLNRLLTAISPQIATAMLAAILLPFCLKAFTPISSNLVTFLILFVGFFASKRLIPKYAMLALLVLAIIVSIYSGSFTDAAIELAITSPAWTIPHFNLQAIINISLPLYIITMLSQNLPGIAMLNSHQYQIKTKPVFIGTGLMTALLAPFGGFSINLAAISAAICMNDDVDEDKNQRYKASMWAGVFYLIAGLWGATVVKLFLLLPQDVSQMLAGLALLGTLLMCLQNAFTDEKKREAALLTFLISLSAVSLAGLSAPIIGLLVGIIYARFSK